ncbi:Acyl-CoA reductase (LuxC) [Daejeonella rubra]|uniref:Acyl-CoA reductase (LuxC) n=1 Tax=Daejeonella rubra TaxID=990371 RepID=A0A1G9MYM1_9SPHI|nr:acyl-CoA reductase [Daejeonella rubra]SDL79214.1 Acyl-CoA reductase (LuxC) [Daejeonella rubra]
MSKILTSKQRIKAFVQLGHILQNPDEQLSSLISSAKQYNAWFSPQSTAMAVNAIAEMLNEPDLEKWADSNTDEPDKMNAVGLVLAGNIPLVGFHDILCVLASGNKALIKLSSQDKQLIPYILGKLTEIEPGLSEQFEFIERLKDFDAVIATGSNNTSRYFEYYFSKVPHIIRKNRNSVAVLNGNESREELRALGHDIFDYYGLGCRNVSKFYVPKGYNFNTFFESIEDFKSVADHHKYNNNYDYNKSIFLVNMDKHLDNGFLLLKEDKRMASPLAVVYYEEYESVEEVEKELLENEEGIQCIISRSDLNMNVLPFGQSQRPGLSDYADGVDTMAFLRGL